MCHTGGVPELLDGIEIVLAAVGLFAVAEAMYAVLYEGRLVDTQNKLSRVPYDGTRLAPFLAGLTARHGHRRTFWLHSGRWHRDSDLLELCRREENGQK